MTVLKLKLASFHHTGKAIPGRPGPTILTDVPLEVFEEIVLFVDEADLLALAMVSRNVNKVAVAAYLRRRGMTVVANRAGHNAEVVGDGFMVETPLHLLAWPTTRKHFENLGMEPDGTEPG